MRSFWQLQAVIPTLAVLVTLAKLAQAMDADPEHQAARRSLRTVAAADREKGLIAPLRFKQQLLICNAYPSDSPILVQKNGREILAGFEDALKFQQCRYLPSRVQKLDRLEFEIRETEAQGTFEVGDLPSSNALLLLVLEKRSAASPIMSFQSFAFPSTLDTKDAQVAVINAANGEGSSSSSTHLKMEDHIAEKEKQIVSKRVEQLNFNRVYSVEEGQYDASITDQHRQGGVAASEELESSTRKALKLARNTNYVILRTGGGQFAESLVVFPEPPLTRAAAVRRATWSWSIASCVLAAALASVAYTL